MSAFAAIFRRDRGPVSERVLALLGDALEHRGRDGRDRLVEGSVGLEHFHHWVTPEEVGERQPLRSGDRVLVFDGRIDNRDELLEALDRRPSEPPLSDAELVLAAHDAWGDAVCRRLIGPFALALFDLEAGSGLLARDPLGDRTLFHARIGADLVVASEEAALLAHPDVSPDLEDSRLLSYFAVSVPDDGATFFRDITELDPGTFLRFDERSIDVRRFWSPPPGRGRRASIVDLAEEYRDLLTQAVACRQRSPAAVGILMSGGLDSTSVAALASSSADRRGTVRPRSISWVFDRVAECDERAFIGAVVDSCRLDRVEFPADQLGPSPDGSGLCLNPSSPEENPYRGLKARAYLEAARAGCQAVLTGGSADALYAGRPSWFKDLLLDRGALVAAGELFEEIGRQGLRGALRRAGLRRRSSASRSVRRPPPWLTPWARRELSGLPAGWAAEMTAREYAAAGPRAARGVSLEQFHAASAGVDLRHPYRDLRLVEFMLSLPGHELYRHGRFKEIARRALAGSLPESVRARTAPSRLTPLFDQAIRGPNREAWAARLSGPQAVWPRFVRREWIDAALNRSAGPAGDVALWNCLSLEIWRRRFGF